MRRSRRTTFLVLISVAALLCASMLAPAFGAPQATSAASLAKKLASTLRIAKRADRNAKRAIKGLQVEGNRGPAGPPGATGAKLQTVRERAERRGVGLALYTADMFLTGNDDDNRAAVRAVATADLDLVGLAVRAPHRDADAVLRGLKRHP